MTLNRYLFSLAAFGAGAALAYFFDPVSGRRRRALARDQLVRAQHQISDYRGIAERKLGERRGASTVDIDLSQ